MKLSKKVLVVFVSVCIRRLESAYRSGCGIDKTHHQEVREGVAHIETYPWLGLLFYPVGIQDDLVTTMIVLVTRQMALAAALDIDKYPKSDFRTLARVVLGKNCSGPYIKVRDYTFHPDFSNNTYNTLAIVQLDTLMAKQEIRPICPPPKRIKHPQIYAMSMTQDCTSAMVRIYKMEYVNADECKDFYRRAELDMESLWPTHYACARATSGGKCVWHSGTILVTRQGNRWQLIGIGVYGPGCEAPARFMDYGIYNKWVTSSLARIGRPAITRLAPNHLIMRRTVDTLQRFGPCNKDEVKAELFTDYTSVIPVSLTPTRVGYVSYNLTLMANVDYSCISLRVFHEDTTMTTPSLRLRRWCTNPLPECYDFSYIQIDFAVDIYFNHEAVYKISAYGKEIRVVDIKAYRTYMNELFYPHEMVIPKTTDGEHHSYFAFVEPTTLEPLEFDQDPQAFGVHHIRTTTVAPMVTPSDNMGNGNYSSESDTFSEDFSDIGKREAHKRLKKVRFAERKQFHNVVKQNAMNLKKDYETF